MRDLSLPPHSISAPRNCLTLTTLLFDFARLRKPSRLILRPWSFPATCRMHIYLPIFKIPGPRQKAGAAHKLKPLSIPPVASENLQDLVLALGSLGLTRNNRGFNVPGYCCQVLMTPLSRLDTQSQTFTLEYLLILMYAWFHASLKLIILAASWLLVFATLCLSFTDLGGLPPCQVCSLSSTFHVYHSICYRTEDYHCISVSHLFLLNSVYLII